MTEDEARKLDDRDLAYHLQYPVMDDRVQRVIEREALYRIFARVTKILARMAL